MAKLFAIWACLPFFFDVTRLSLDNIFIASDECNVLSNYFGSSSTSSTSAFTIKVTQVECNSKLRVSIYRTFPKLEHVLKSILGTWQLFAIFYCFYGHNWHFQLQFWSWISFSQSRLLFMHKVTSTAVHGVCKEWSFYLIAGKITFLPITAIFWESDNQSSQSSFIDIYLDGNIINNI